MNKITEHIFKNLKPNFARLQEYGFTASKGGCFYNTEIMNGGFTLKIEVIGSSVETELIDNAMNEPYTLFLADGASGGFVGAVRTAYETVLLDIAEKCFDKFVFKSDYAQKLIEYVSAKYGDELEYLWEKFPDNAIWRRADNKKWYGALLTVTKNKLGLPSEEKIEIVDLRVPADTIDTVVDGKTIFYGYHMNKKHWVTVCLDGSVPLPDIKKMLDNSYELARKA